MNAVVITVGDEILRGRTVDSNSTWISRELAALGVEVTEHVVVPDKIVEIVAAMNRVSTDIIILTGGLGPTPDDITRNAFAEFLGVPLELSEDELEIIRNRFRDRGIEMSPSNRIQAMIPKNSKTIPNPVGMAPGISDERHGSFIISLPGVPSEMKAMLGLALEPLNLSVGKGINIVRTIGIPESVLYDMLDIVGYEDMIGFYPSSGLVDIVMKPALPTIVRERIETILKDYTYSHREGQRIEEMIQGMMIEKGLTLSTAESCTGGMLASAFVDIPGSSAYFQGGVVSYTNELKQSALGVCAESLERFGAVSKQVAAEMASGACRITGADIALSTTGIAGPDGGTDEKPVGLVFVGLAVGEKKYIRKYRFAKNRQGNRERTVVAACQVLWLHLTDQLDRHRFLDGSEEAC